MADPTSLSSIVEQLVLRGWQRDWENVQAPCWYLLSDEITEGEVPTLRHGAPETLAIWPPKPCPWFLYLEFSACGILLSVQVLVHESPGYCAEGIAGTILDFGALGLDALLGWAQEIYEVWERWGNQPVITEASHD